MAAVFGIPKAWFVNKKIKEVQNSLGLLGLLVAITALNLQVCIMKACLYNFDPRKPHFYIVKLGFTGVYIIFLISAQKHRL